MSTTFSSAAATIEDMAKAALIERLKAASEKGRGVAGAEPIKAEKKVMEFIGDVSTEEDGVPYSVLFGYLPPSGVDFYIPVYKDEDWDEDSRMFIPSLDEFKGFVVDHEVLEAEMLALVHGLKVLVVGPSGSGKTTLQKYICAKTRQPYLRINGRQDMESDAILGRPWVSEGSMHYELGELPKALKAGWFIAFDEPWKTPAGIQMALQRMYERGGILQIDEIPGTLKDKQIIPDPRTKFVMCDNVVGTGDSMDKFAATMIQDGSTLNRIDVVLNMGYLPMEKEVEMVMNMHSFIPKEMATKMVQLFNLLRVNYDQGELSVAASPRNLYTWGKMAGVLKSYEKAFQMVMLNRYAEESEKNTVRTHYSTVFTKCV